MIEIISYGIKNKCSDIHITEGKQPKVREYGVIKPMNQFNLITSDEIEEFMERHMPFKLKAYEDLAKNKSNTDIDASFECLGRRLRANIYKGIGGISIALRLLEENIPNIEELLLPSSVHRFAKFIDGLVLIVGTTGSGKSTTIASIINEINNMRCVNILTVEDPIEYIYKENKARIEQREVGAHVSGFCEAVRSAMRQDPDVILVGELRDLDTIANTITLAETGHLVLGTLHAKSVSDTVERIIDVFPSQQQEQIRVQLSSVLRGIVHQRLVPNLQGGLIPLAEVLMVDDVISGMIRQRQKSNSMRDYLRSQKEHGSIHLADNAVWHCQNNRFELEQLKNILSGDDYTLAKSILHHEQDKKYAFGGGV